VQAYSDRGSELLWYTNIECCRDLDYPSIHAIEIKEAAEIFRSALMSIGLRCVRAIDY
jgi:hypothetical protein